METKGFFQFEIIIKILLSSLLFIWIPMLWVYGHYKYFNSVSVGNVFIRQNLTSTDVRFWRLKTVPVMKGLMLEQHQTRIASTSRICWVLTSIWSSSIRILRWGCCVHCGMSIRTLRWECCVHAATFVVWRRRRLNLIMFICILISCQFFN